MVVILLIRRSRGVVFKLPSTFYDIPTLLPVTCKLEGAIQLLHVVYNELNMIFSCFM